MTESPAPPVPSAPTAEQEYFHGVGRAGRARIHHELATHHERCPLCGAQLRWSYPDEDP